MCAAHLELNKIMCVCDVTRCLVVMLNAVKTCTKKYGANTSRCNRHFPFHYHFLCDSRSRFSLFVQGHFVQFCVIFSPDPFPTRKNFRLPKVKIQCRSNTLLSTQQFYWQWKRKNCIWILHDLQHNQNKLMSDVNTSTSHRLVASWGFLLSPFFFLPKKRINVQLAQNVWEFILSCFDAESSIFKYQKITHIQHIIKLYIF